MAVTKRPFLGAGDIVRREAELRQQRLRDFFDPQDVAEKAGVKDRRPEGVTERINLGQGLLQTFQLNIREAPGPQGGVVDAGRVEEGSPTEQSPLGRIDIAAAPGDRHSHCGAQAPRYAAIRGLPDINGREARQTQPQGGFGVIDEQGRRRFAGGRSNEVRQVYGASLTGVGKDEIGQSAQSDRHKRRAVGREGCCPDVDELAERGLELRSGELLQRG